MTRRFWVKIAPGETGSPLLAQSGLVATPCPESTPGAVPVEAVMTAWVRQRGGAAQLQQLAGVARAVMIEAGFDPDDAAGMLSAILARPADDRLALAFDLAAAVADAQSRMAIGEIGLALGSAIRAGVLGERLRLKPREGAFVTGRKVRAGGAKGAEIRHGDADGKAVTREAVLAMVDAKERALREKGYRRVRCVAREAVADEQGIAARTIQRWEQEAR